MNKVIPLFSQADLDAAVALAQARTIEAAVNEILTSQSTEDGGWLDSPKAVAAAIRRAIAKASEEHDPNKVGDYIDNSLGKRITYQEVIA